MASRDWVGCDGYANGDDTPLNDDEEAAGADELLFVLENRRWSKAAAFFSCMSATKMRGKRGNRYSSSRVLRRGHRRRRRRRRKDGTVVARGRVAKSSVGAESNGVGNARFKGKMELCDSIATAKCFATSYIVQWTTRYAIHRAILRLRKL